MTAFPRPPYGLLLTICLLCCRSPLREATDPPPPPTGTDPLRIDVVYPSQNSLAEIHDSALIYGNVGNSQARLTVNGRPVPVAATSAFLAWLPLPGSATDTIASYHLVAMLGDDTIRATRTVRLPNGWRSTRTGRAAIDSTGLFPVGTWWVREGESIPLRVRATRGARVQLRLPDGASVRLIEQKTLRRVTGWVQAPARSSADSLGTGLYEGSWVVRRPLGRGVWSNRPPVAQLRGSRTPQSTAYVEVTTAHESVRVPLALDLSILEEPRPVVELRDPEHLGGSDGGILGRATPEGAPAWLWASGVRARVTGRQNDALRIALDQRTDGWVSLEDVTWLPDATLFLPTQVGAVSVDSAPDYLAVRVPVGQPVPYLAQLDEDRFALTLYGVQAASYWLRYGHDDGFLRGIRWEQAASDRYVLYLTLADKPWGYRVRYRPGALLVELRKPPVVEAGRPLAGLRVVLDAGHPPGGVIGPTRLSESDVNLAVAFRAKRLLEREGATVLLTRATRGMIEQSNRVLRAEAAEGDLLVSLHNNGPVPGVNPSEALGTTVYYCYPPAADLARALQASLVRDLGQRDLGIAQTTLALQRVSWLPTVVVEGPFMAAAEQEAALRDPGILAAYARGVTEGIRTFVQLRGRRNHRPS